MFAAIWTIVSRTFASTRVGSGLGGGNKAPGDPC